MDKNGFLIYLDSMKSTIRQRQEAGMLDALTASMSINVLRVIAEDVESGFFDI